MANTTEQVTAAWPSSTSSLDNDSTVLAGIGGGAVSIDGRVYHRSNASGLIQNGWSFVGHYVDV